MAREKALELRREIDVKRGPIAERRQAKGVSFKEAAEALIESKRPGWRNEKHAPQWRSTLETSVYPKLGHLDVRVIDTRSVLDGLRPVWTEKP